MTTAHQIEGILFAMGDSVEIRDLARALDLPPEEVRLAADELEEELTREDRGIRLVRLEERLQLGSSRECYPSLVRLVSRPKKPVLTGAALETLSIIAYRQPVTKAEISKIRGVNSDHAVNKLMEFGLVCEAGRMDAPGRPILLATTEEFLRRFGLSSVEDLPEISAEKREEFQEEAERESARSEEKVPVDV